MAGVSDALKPATGLVADLLDASGSERDYIVDAFGPEVTSLILQVPLDLVTSRLGGEVANVGIGLATLLWAALGKPAPRTQRDLYEISAHFLNRSISARPSDIAEMLNDFKAMRFAAAQGNLQGVRASLVRTPDEVTSQVRALSMMAANAFSDNQVPRNVPQTQPQQPRAAPQVVSQNGTLVRPGPPTGSVLA